MPRNRRTYLTSSTSSLCDYFLCHWCNTKFLKRHLIIAHLRKCNNTVKKTRYSLEKWRQMFTCADCNIVYANRKTLARHIVREHSEKRKPKKYAEQEKTIKGSNKQDKSTNEQPKADIISKEGAQKLQSNSPLKKCEVCTEICPNKTKLWLHIRKEHFNLQAKLPYCDQKKVNQVWFEKVLNCNNIMEIKKTGPNTLVMRKLDEKTSIKVFDNNTKIIDLSDLYPTKL